MEQTKEASAASLPFAILRPKVVRPRTELYTSITSPIPRTMKQQKLLSQLLPFLNMKPTVVDLETEGLRPEGTAGKDKKVVAVSLANDVAVSSWNLRGQEGQQVWRQILELLYKHRTPLLAHNMNFDYAWMTRDLNLKNGELPRWFGDFRFLNIHGCTQALLRQLASEGFLGQQYGLGWAQTHLMGWESSNKEERQRKLVEAALLKKPLKKSLLEKLLPDKEERDEFMRRCTPKLTQPEPEEDECLT